MGKNPSTSRKGKWTASGHATLPRIACSPAPPAVRRGRRSDILIPAPRRFIFIAFGLFVSMFHLTTCYGSPRPCHRHSLGVRGHCSAPAPREPDEGWMVNSCARSDPGKHESRCRSLGEGRRRPWGASLLKPTNNCGPRSGEMSVDNSGRRRAGDHISGNSIKSEKRSDGSQG